MMLRAAPVSSMTPICCPLIAPSTTGWPRGERTAHSAIRTNVHLPGSAAVVLPAARPATSASRATQCIGRRFAVRLAGKNLRDARFRLAALADRGDKFAVLELDAVHRNID